MRFRSLIYFLHLSAKRFEQWSSGRRLLVVVSVFRLIFAMIKDLYKETTGIVLTTGMEK